MKRLFALSGNRCAFPKCPVALVDTDSGKVTGRVCHIKARSKKGPRYDPNQTPAERNGFDNLLLLCPFHHDVVDADVMSYSVERLVEIKRDHETANAGGSEPPAEIALSALFAKFGDRVELDKLGGCVRCGKVRIRSS